MKYKGLKPWTIVWTKYGEQTPKAIEEANVSKKSDPRDPRDKQI